MYNQSLLYKVTWYYYVDNMTQKEIAEHLNISRMKVVKMLNQAKNDGIVKFKITNVAIDKMKLENKLIEKYSLDDIFILPTTPSDLNENLAKGAAKYIEQRVKPNSYISIGYGDTVSKTISELIYTTDIPISLVTLSGGVSYYTSSIISGAHKRPSNSPTPSLHIMPAPLIASSEKVAKVLLGEPSVKDILDMAKLSTVSVVGIGASNEKATIFKYGVASLNDLTMLKMKGAVGDILSQFYDKDGNIIDSPLHKKLVSTTLENLTKAGNVVAVAGGKSKLQAIHSALLGNFVNVLITDEETARNLLERK